MDPTLVLCPRPCFRREEAGDVQPAVDAGGAEAAGGAARAVPLGGRRDGAMEEDRRSAWEQDPNPGRGRAPGTGLIL